MPVDEWATLSSWVPPHVDTTTPSVARMYDYFLGGNSNFKCDREQAVAVGQILPNVSDICRANRGFLRRAVRFCVRRGVRQFLDIGSGIPTAGNVHQVAHRLDPTIRVVYVDHEPIAVAHSELMLKNNACATAIQSDLRTPDDVLSHPKTTAMLDFDQPIALLMGALLHFVPDSDDPLGLLSRYRKALSPGSFLALSHDTSDFQAAETIREVLRLYRNTSDPLYLRTHAEVVTLFEGFDLVAPGVVFTSQWHPADDDIPVGKPEALAIYCGVGQKP